MRACSAALGVALTLVAAPLAAQRAEFGVGIGAGYPARGFSTGAKLGVTGMATLAYRLGEGPVALRVDAEYAEFRGKRAPAFTYPRHRVRAMRVSAEYEYGGGEYAESRTRAWAFGGVGAYYDEVDRGEPQVIPFGRTHPGVQFGAGGAVKLGGVKPFVEIGFLTIIERGVNTRFFPFIIGFRIGGR